MSCIATFVVNPNSGTSIDFSIEVPGTQESLSQKDLLSIIEQINKKDNKTEEEEKFLKEIEELFTLINQSNLMSQQVVKTNFVTGKQLQGNKSMSEFIGEHGGGQWTQKMFSDVGVALDTKNILFINPTNNNLTSYINKDGQALFIVPNNKYQIDSFFKVIYLQSILIKDAAIHAKDLREILKGQAPKEDDDIKFIQKFVLRYFSDKNFISNSYSRQHIDQWFNSLLMFEGKKLSIDEDFNAIVKNGKISKKDFEKYLNKKKTPNKSIQEVLLDINGEDNRQGYLSVERVDENYIVLKPLLKQPQFTVDNINIDFYGISTQPMEEYRGYTIVQHNNKYYISDSSLLQAEDFLGDYSYSNIIYAKNAIDTILNKTLVEGKERTNLRFNSIQNKIKKSPKNKSLLIKHESTKQLYKVGELIKTLDLQLPDKFKTTLKGQVYQFYNDLIEHLQNGQYYKEYFTKYNLKSIIDSKEKLEALIILLNNTKINEHLGEANYSDKVQKEVDKIIKNIQEAKTVVYRVEDIDIDKDSQKITLTKLDTTPVVVKGYRSIKQDLLYIKGHLEENFDIKINLVTTKELLNNSKFRGIVSNPTSTKAFILNSEVYVNMDIANTGDLLHEYGHMVMAYIKSRPETSYIYYKLLDRITQFPDYANKIKYYREVLKDKRSEIDLQEEIFVEAFGKYSGKRVNQWYNSLSKDFQSIEDKFKVAQMHVFQLDPNVQSDIENSTLEDIFKELNSQILVQKQLDKEALNTTIKSRKITNLIAELISAEHIKEDCK